MRNYFYKELEEEITTYFTMLEKYLKYPEYKVHKVIKELLLLLTQKLVDLSIPKPVIAALKFMCLNYSFFPKPYLFQA